MPAVSIQYQSTAFDAGGPLYLPGQIPGSAVAHATKVKSKYVIQTQAGRGIHINGKAPPPGSPPNSLSVVVHYNMPYQVETPEEFNLLPYPEIRSEIANAVEDGILEVIDSTGSPASITAIRSGTVG